MYTILQKKIEVVIRNISFLIICSLMTCLAISEVKSQNCELFDMTADIVCDGDSFFVVLSFQSANTSDSFRVAGNGNNYGSYEYNAIPLTLGPLPANNTPYEFVAIDLLDPNCSDFVDVGVVDCDTNSVCSITDLIVEFDECTSDSTYRIEVDFDHENTGIGFDAWTGNGIYLGFFSYNDLPLTIDHYPQGPGMTNGLLICDNDNANCCEDASWPNPECGSAEDCDIRDMVAETVDCTEDSFWVEFNFIHEFTSDSFVLRGNGQVYGVFAYDDLPVVLGPFAHGATVNEFVVVDSEDGDCKEDIAFEVDCGDDCTIRNVEVDFIECTSDSTYRIVLDFDYDSTSNGFFTVWDDNGDLVGFFALADFPVTIDDFPQSPGMTNGLQVCENNNSDCCEGTSWPNPMCGSGEDCDIRDLVAEAVDCTEDSFWVEINFIHEFTSDSFVLRGNGQVYGTYAYADLPIVLGPFSHQSNINEFVVIDSDNPDCREDTHFDNDCFGGDCELWDLEVETGQMITDSTFELTFNFQYEGVSDSFDAWSGQMYLGRFAYADLPIEIMEFPTRGLEYELLRVCEAQLNACCTAIEFMYTDCEECAISEITAQAVECTEDTAFVIVDFNINDGSNSGFEIIGNGFNYGQFSYDDLPVEIAMPYDSGAFIDLIIRDLLHAHCLQYVYIESLNCDTECRLFEVVADFQECTSDSTYNFILNLDHEGTGGLGFDLLIDGDHFGFYEYDDLPVLVENFPSDGQGNDVFVLCDNDNLDCCTTFEIPVPNCISGFQETDNERSIEILNSPGVWEVIVPEKGKISVYDMTGRQVVESVEVSDRYRVQGLVSGMYIVTWSGSWGSVSQTAVYISQ